MKYNMILNDARCAMTNHILPCLCGCAPMIETDRAPEYLNRLHRLVCCVCGHVAPQWSASVHDAIWRWEMSVSSSIGQLIAAYSNYK